MGTAGASCQSEASPTVCVGGAASGKGIKSFEGPRRQAGQAVGIRSRAASCDRRAARGGRRAAEQGDEADEAWLTSDLRSSSPVYNYPLETTAGAGQMEPIFEAVLESETGVARLLRDHPSAVGTRASRDTLVETIPHWVYAGDTALHLAAAGLRTQAALVLLDAGADPNAPNRRGATPLHYSCDPRPRSGATWGPTAQASLIELLVERGADVYRGDRGGATALHRAVRARSVAAVRRLLALGARTDCVLKARSSSPLHLAAQPTGAGGTAGMLDDQLEIIDLLLQHGADPAAPDAAGRTPSGWARNERVANALRRSRPDPA